MSDDFASATTTTAPEDAGMATAAAPVPIPASMPDINQLDQYNDVDEIDEGASTYDRALPPHDGWHQLKLTAVKDGIAEAKRFMPEKFSGSVSKFEFDDREGKHQVHFQIVVDSQVVNEEGKQGNGQSVREWISTMPQTVNEKTTTQVDSLLAILTGRSGVGMSRLQKIAALYSVLVKEPVVNGKTQWVLQASEASPVKNRKTGEVVVGKDGREKTEYKTFKYGERSFPEVRDGAGQVTGHMALEEDPETGAQARTRFRVVDMKPLSAKVI